MGCIHQVLQIHHGIQPARCSKAPLTTTFAFPAAVSFYQRSLWALYQLSLPRLLAPIMPAADSSRLRQTYRTATCATEYCVEKIVKGARA
jgi:hypothetical protein